MAPFFILFFGLMMADMAYGLLMIFGSLLFLRKKRPADPSFMEMIFWCGIATFLFGALTGGFFGDFIPQLCRLINPQAPLTSPRCSRRSTTRWPSWSARSFSAPSRFSPA